ncbi:TPA: hypothetical protein DIV55_00470 [Patescibacteria group bacterium]|uniref:Tetratricopeptide repeat protein n=1 Tax=Candidatus Gottesmanbacteria bacterium GW2011_GWA1_43_11 TaxID=1618436 RepID=A0A0G1CHC4_9BACT|nr:MAG: hypothetical protein UV59_C0012G0015 [Candidatus Gottesmanbacteria bacterium GW2011_GWA1_43_11]HCS78200.1 hypothetical protein [Patescibacteria group bacterium]
MAKETQESGQLSAILKQAQQLQIQGEWQKSTLLAGMVIDVLSPLYIELLLVQGLNYRMEKQYATAEQIFNTALVIAEHSGDTEQQILVLGSLMDVTRKNKQFGEAVNYDLKAKDLVTSQTSSENIPTLR